MAKAPMASTQSQGSYPPRVRPRASPGGRGAQAPRAMSCFFALELSISRAPLPLASLQAPACLTSSFFFFDLSFRSISRRPWGAPRGGGGSEEASRRAGGGSARGDERQTTNALTNTKKMRGRKGRDAGSTLCPHAHGGAAVTHHRCGGSASSRTARRPGRSSALNLYLLDSSC